VILAGASALIDSLSAASARHVTSETWSAFMEAWHDYFVLAGSAAAALAALLFVAMSLHIETLVASDSRSHLLALARTILFSFVMVLILSLMMLVPFGEKRPTAMELIMLGGVSTAITLRQMRGQSAVAHAHFSLGLFRRRLYLPLLGYAFIAATGVLMLTVTPMFFFWMVGAVALLLGNAAGTSWDLLVRVARIKRADAEQEFGQKRADVG
jgi:hypothetical protein